MTLTDYLRVLRERWIVIVTAVVLALGCAAGIWFLRPPEYTAALTMYVSAQTADTTSTAYQGAQLSEQRVKSYVELVGSPRVCQEVVRNLRLAESPDELADRITAASSADSVLIDISVTDRSPQRAADMANAVGQSFTRLVNELERPVVRDALPPVAVRMVQPAGPPTEPSSTGLPVLLALGLLAGLATGAGAALLRNALDASMKAPEQLRHVAGAPNLGTIAYDPQVPKRPLTVHEDQQSPRAEAFRQLRTSLQFVDVDHPRKVIVVTSSMPGEGKTTTLANLGIALASAGHRVLVVEADLRRPKLADLLGLNRSIGLTNILSGRLTTAQTIQHWAGGGVDVLASGPLPPNPSELLASHQMSRLLTALRSEYDVVLIDTPPLLPVTDAAAVAPAADGVILVCRFKKTSRNQVAAAVEALPPGAARLLGTVFTMVPAKGPRAYAQYNSYYRSIEQGTPADQPGATSAGAPRYRASRSAHGAGVRSPSRAQT
jgi:capsular exopolysaccharide synthesis family protein